MPYVCCVGCLGRDCTSTSSYELNLNTKGIYSQHCGGALMIVLQKKELVELFKRGLGLSNVDSSKSIAILKNVYSDPVIVNAAIEAAEFIGVNFYIVEVIEGVDNVHYENMIVYNNGQVLNGYNIGQSTLESVDLVFETLESATDGIN